MSQVYDAVVMKYFILICMFAVACVPSEPDGADDPQTGLRPETPTFVGAAHRTAPQVEVVLASGQARSVDQLPFTDSGTLPGTSSREDYDCPGDWDGPEETFRFRVGVSGALVVQAAGEGGATALILGDGGCLDAGARAAAWVEPGVYTVVVEGAGPGDYRLDLNFVDQGLFVGAGMSDAFARHALWAWTVGWERGETERFEYATTDFSLHSRHRRQWIWDLLTGELLFHLHVGHGDASSSPSDPGVAVRFSNVPESHQSSIGMLRTAESYTGDFGYSHRLDGVEPGFNDNVRRRDIVMHPSAGSRPSFIQDNGYTLETWGCPAVDDEVSTEVVDLMHTGALSFFYYPDPTWLATSPYSADAAGPSCGDAVCGDGEEDTCPADCPVCGLLPPEGGTIDEGDCFERFGPDEYWRRVEGDGHGGSLYWTQGFVSEQPSNWARWTVAVPAAGTYRVETAVHPEFAQSRRAPWSVTDVDGRSDLIVDLTGGVDWVSLGEFSFEAGRPYPVEVYDNSGDMEGEPRRIMADALRVTPLR